MRRNDGGANMHYEHTVCDGIDLNFIIDDSDEENEEEWLR